MKTLKKRLQWFVILPLLASLAFLVAPSATATNTTTVTNECVAHGLPAEQCEVTESHSVGTPTPATTTQLQQFDTAPAVRYTVYCNWWKQTMANAGPDVWREMHKGRFCYDHHNVWIHRYGAYHRCGLNEKEIVWTVSVQECYDSKVRWPAAQGGYFRRNWDRFKTCYPFPYPYCIHRTMHVNVFPSGKFVFHANP